MTKTQTKTQLLVVDDDERLRSLLEQFLRSKDYAVRSAAHAKQAYELLERNYFDLIVLDLMLPGEDGLTICQKLREQGNKVPIIILTAKGDESSRIQGLELGADDYLAKPFNPEELLARIKAVLRRTQNVNFGAPAIEQDISFGKFTLLMNTREIDDGQTKHLLTTSEFAVLRALIAHAGEPLTRDKLMRLARGREWNAVERSIDVQISRLRRIIEDDPAKPRYLQTVWGTGYIFML